MTPDARREAAEESTIPSLVTGVPEGSLDPVLHDNQPRFCPVIEKAHEVEDATNSASSLSAVLTLPEEAGSAASAPIDPEASSWASIVLLNLPVMFSSVNLALKTSVERSLERKRRK